MLIPHKRYIPAYFMKDHPDQYPLCLYTILSVNERVGDCAAYEVIGPTEVTEPQLEMMKGGGNKISEVEARELFREIEEMKLRYRR